MHINEIPMPLRVASRLRDPRGIPVPAVTQWERGAPLFGETSSERQLLCALRNRCGVCGGELTGEDNDIGVWHIVDDQATRVIRYALRRGEEPAASFTTPEVPGHYTCMLYAAVACPYLAAPTARRTVGPAHAGMHPTRGALSGLVEFATCQVTTSSTGYEVELVNPRTIYPYAVGAELLPLLLDAVATERPASRPSRDWFGPDNRVVTRELHRALHEI